MRWLMASRMIHLDKLPRDHFRASRQGVEFRRVIGLLQDFLSFLIAIHRKQDLLEPIHD
jgi:hypothetical protein